MARAPLCSRTPGFRFLDSGARNVSDSNVSFEVLSRSNLTAPRDLVAWLLISTDKAGLVCP